MFDEKGGVLVQNPDFNESECLVCLYEKVRNIEITKPRSWRWYGKKVRDE
jgi:hypothetical protein